MQNESHPMFLATGNIVDVIEIKILRQLRLDICEQRLLVNLIKSAS